MASIARDPNGRKRILFVGADGRRRAIRLGKFSVKQGEALKVRVEQLVSSSITRHPPDDDTSRWLAGLDELLHAKLAAVGLVKPRESLELRGFIDKYLAGCVDLKPKSLRALQGTRDKLLAYFGPDIALRAITAEHASDWRLQLAGAGLAVASVKHHVGNAKGILNEAARRGLIPSNPFEHLQGGATAAKNDRYVTPEEADAILQACPDTEHRLLFGLARLAGLRVPSETHLLTWADVNWEKGRLRVRSPKTERHAGHQERMVPVVPQLLRLLQDAFDEAEPGAERLVTMRGGAVHRRFEAIIRRAGVEPWRNLWKTCRASCEQEWAMTFPQYAVSLWIGHSITVSGKHYANAVPDEIFDAASGTGGAESGARAAQNAAQQASAQGRADPQEGGRNDAKSLSDTGLCEPVRSAAASHQIGATGFEPATS